MLCCGLGGSSGESECERISMQGQGKVAPTRALTRSEVEPGARVVGAREQEEANEAGHVAAEEELWQGPGPGKGQPRRDKAQHDSGGKPVLQ